MLAAAAVLLVVATGVDAAALGMGAEPWQAWVPARQGSASPGGASGKDLEVGVAIGMPSAPNAAPQGWYPFTSNPNEGSGFVQRFLKVPSSQPSYQPIQMMEPAQPVSYFQPPQPLVAAYQPVQPFQQVSTVPQFETQSVTYYYQQPEWEAVAPPPASPPQLLRAPGSSALLAPTPFAQRRVGAFRLRNDRGYQLQMEVPPMAVPPGAPADGVMVMEMKATLYRPVA